MKNLLFLIVLFLFSTNIFAQKTINLYPITDDGIGFHFAANAANINYHNDKWNIAHAQPGGLGIAIDTGRTLILFDFASVPKNITIKKIAISLFAYPNQAGPTYNGHAGKNNATALQRITSSWIPTVTTWNTRPKVTTNNQVILPKSTSQYQDFLDIDVTDLFMPMVLDSKINFGIQMKLVEEIPTNVMIFCSTNYADQTKHPKLTIYYEDEPQVTGGGTTNNNGGTTTTNTNNTNTTTGNSICESTEHVFIPEAFSPNDDGINDFFTIFAGNELHINFLQIFDRWGNLIFENTDFLSNDEKEGWNGKFRGENAQNATYVYMVKFTDKKNCVKIIRGDFTLWR
jgi:gliding motility-associated-like protein